MTYRVSASRYQPFFIILLCLRITRVLSMYLIVLQFVYCIIYSFYRVLASRALNFYRHFLIKINVPTVYEHKMSLLIINSAYRVSASRAHPTLRFN